MSLQPFFQTTVHGKFIVAGEHAVLRGSPALVFPVRSRQLSLKYMPSRRPLEIKSAQEGQVELIAMGLVEKALSLLEHSKSELQGELMFDNTIPVGSGLGASAALCVSVARLLEWKGWLNSEELYEFARELENIFHGESSGVDIAVAALDTPILFERGGRRQKFKPAWTPHWTLSHCGARGLTSDAIARVKQLIADEPERAAMLDAQMKASVLAACEALSAPGGEALLAKALNEAGRCFRDWGLTQGLLDQKMNELRERGALAVKPTGSGLGGYILSLWPGEPPAGLNLLKI
ncbi:MAG TPA: hypothetical protein VFV50_04680 [Bdellovibrionales bacterium]|nr:hypothetical protein [Bdellovibrionales bacterium]